MCTTIERSTENGKIGERLKNGIHYYQIQYPKNYKMNWVLYFQLHTSRPLP